MKRIISFFLLFSALFSLCACKENNNGGNTDIAEIAADFEVYCFSAGKADSFLLTTENSAVLIDAGESGFGKTILDYMEEKGISTLDYLIISHFDKDHVGGAAKVINKAGAGTVLQSNYLKDSSQCENYLEALQNAGIEAITVREVYTFTLDGAEYTVYPPAQEEYSSNPSNNSSLIVSVKYGERSFLFTGDAQNERIAEFVEENNSHYDFLKVPYHGHWQKNLELLLSDIDAKYAVITSSEEELEDEKTVDLLNKYGLETFLTRTAPVIVLCDGKNISVKYVQ